MSSDRPRPALGGLVSRWIGVALTLIASVATVWLGVTGRLELYVHPRYTVFTVVMALVGGALAVAAILTRPVPDRDADPHEIETEPLVAGEGRTGWRALLTTGRVAILVVAAVALLVLPPSALTARTAQSRAPSTTDTTALSSSVAPRLTGASAASFTVKDWAALLRTGDATVAGRSATVTAYVLPVDGARNEFYAARLLVTCCVVDAQPVAVPVYLEDWRSRFAPNQWVRISGHFQQNPDAGSGIPTVLVPDRIARTPEPAKPYVY